ncbi:hypothetical protein [Methanobacterium alcaliphilum]|uniref:hypothetical protein n=1 Tax=Methanobacterium alcaliphilum TaxID=392018 RepID=UPI00200A5A74|nr:hypothetical protein [Methanobacterium alcaliphilum]
MTCKQNDTAKVTAQLWAENTFWDNPITLQDLDLYIYPKNQNTIVFQATEETDWPTGEATFRINTKNMEPGTYTLKVRFDGGSEIFGSFRPCSTYSTFTVTT